MRIIAPGVTAGFGALCLAAVLFCLSGPAAATLFTGDAKNLADEVKQAQHEGRRLALYFELPDCPGCREMKKHVFSNPRSEREFGRRYRTRRIDLASTATLIDSHGQSTTPAALAQRWGIAGTPAFAFLSPQGELDFRHVGSLPVPADFISLGRFVAEAAYEKQPFAAFRQRHGQGLYAPASPLAEVKPDFELRDPHGRLRHLSDFRGKSVALAVGYLYCPDVCPTTLFELKSAVEALGPAARQVQVLFATLDPERDTPQALAAYVTAFHRDFLGLRGDAAQTAAFIQRFSLIAEKQASSSLGYSLDHTAGVFLFDRSGRLRGFSPYGQPLDLLTADLKKLAREGQPPAALASHSDTLTPPGKP